MLANYGIPLVLVCIALLVIAMAAMVVDIKRRRLAMQRSEAEAQWVETAAISDALTGLANRPSLEKNILQRLAQPEAEQSPFALIYLDITNYREMMAQLSNWELDKSIKEIAQKVKNCLGESDDYLLARYSAGSFMIVVNNHESTQHQFVYRRLQALKGLTAAGGERVVWQAGQSAFPQSGHSSRRLIRAALVGHPLSDIGSFDNLSKDPRMVRTG